MTTVPQLRSERLILRAWRDDDLDEFAAINADPRVREYFPSTLSRAESDAGARRIAAHFDQHGFGVWAVEVIGDAPLPFIGCLGLGVPTWTAHFTPCVEIAWDLAASVWGRGYASEGARAVLRFAFETLGLDEVVAMTVPANHRSLRVMEKLGMRRDPADDFDHPCLPQGHPLQRHVLYRARAGLMAGR